MTDREGGWRWGPQSTPAESTPDTDGADESGENQRVSAETLAKRSLPVVAGHLVPLVGVFGFGWRAGLVFVWYTISVAAGLCWRLVGIALTDGSDVPDRRYPGYGIVVILKTLFGTIPFWVLPGFLLYAYFRNNPDRLPGLLTLGGIVVATSASHVVALVRRRASEIRDPVGYDRQMWFAIGPTVSLYFGLITGLFLGLRGVAFTLPIWLGVTDVGIEWSRLRAELGISPSQDEDT